MPVNVLFAARPERWSTYETPLTTAFSAAGIDANLSPDIPADQVDYIVYAPNSDVQDFTPFTRAKAVAEWVIGDSANAAIGQGFVLTSPLQLAVMASRLATGRSVTPRLIKSINGVEQPTGHGEELGLNENLLREVRKAMFAVSNNRRGTAYRSRIIEDAFRMAGKTGTSQVRNISTGERASGVRKNSALPWEQRDHALFVSFAPFDAPKVAVAVVIEHGGGGSTAAAPVARDITLQALYGEDPPLAAYPEKDRGHIKTQQEQLRRAHPQSAKDESDRA